MRARLRADPSIRPPLGLVGALVLVLAFAALLPLADSNPAPCAPLHHLLASRNTSNAPDTAVPGPICGGQCCSAGTEVVLKTAGRRDLENLLRHHAISLHGLFATTASALQSHVLELARQSENKTLYLFQQVYSKMSVFSKKPIGDLYSDIRNYINNSSDVAGSSDLNVENSVSDFFTNLFPLVYHHAVNNLNVRDFTEEYKTCLRQSVKEIQPFGDIPRQISHSMYKSLEATRVLLQALALGSEVLNTTDMLLNEGAEKTESTQNACHLALLKMSYCPHCLGLDVHLKPCSGFCLNVLRGCLTQHVSELDLPWNSYVEAVERLVIAVKAHDKNVNADTLLRGLDTRISEAIMYAMENGPSLEKKVKRACGHAVFFGEDSSTVSDDGADVVSSGKPHRVLQVPIILRISPLDTQMLHFLASVAKSKGFFLNLADTLCRDDSFAEQGDGKLCWNGERIGEYSKPVAGSSVSLQKYNPEMELLAKTPVQNGADSDDRIVKLSHRLKHMRQLVMQQISSSPQPSSESFMQGDMAEGDSWEGSGSGVTDMFDPSDEENNEWDGSGSGDNQPENNPTPTVQVDNGSESKPGGILVGSGAISTHYQCLIFSFVSSLVIHLSARNYIMLL
ncbi:division abnormally delayed protein [Arctopsyche grandis]|uniref:division abnormally delayed protein n=1 Tax=Arctopsyche grandis TaxID=121162 RepID=UPI00406D9630